MGWVVGFEPTYTGATTLGLNRLTIPTMPVFLITCSLSARITALVPDCTHLFIKVGDLERARTVDLQRDRLAF